MNVTFDQAILGRPGSSSPHNPRYPQVPVDGVNGKWGEVLVLKNMENRGLLWKKSGILMNIMCLWHW